MVNRAPFAFFTLVGLLLGCSAGKMELAVFRDQLKAARALSDEKGLHNEALRTFASLRGRLMPDSLKAEYDAGLEVSIFWMAKRGADQERGSQASGSTSGAAESPFYRYGEIGFVDQTRLRLRVLGLGMDAPTCLFPIQPAAEDRGGVQPTTKGINVAVGRGGSG